jgi:hypothetical protein
MPDNLAYFNLFRLARTDTATLLVDGIEVGPLKGHGLKHILIEAKNSKEIRPAIFDFNSGPSTSRSRPRLSWRCS